MTSIRGDRSSYRDRDDRDHDEAARRTYTTIKRYQIPDSGSSTSRTVYRDDKEETKEKIIVRRERKDDSPPPREREREKTEVDYRVTERVVEREPRRDISYRIVERDFDRDDTRSQIRVIERDRESVRAPSEERVREFRFERDRDWGESDERPYELERYSKSTEYFQQPQPIIIRERAAQPIIIREERREPQRIIIRREEPQYEFVERREAEEKSEVKSHVTSLVKREEPPPPAPIPEQPPQEDYFYERRVVERRRRSNSFDRHTEVRPRDSASQYSSDDSYEYVRKERTYESDKRSMSPHHKRHLAEGAIAGIAAGEILRHHRKSQGGEVGNRAVSGLAGGVVGALGAEGLSRMRSRRNSRRSRSRSFSGERDRDRDRRDRRRSRSSSRPKHFSQTEKLGGLAVVAAGAALVGYALNNKNKGKETVVIKDGSHRRRKSRRRGGSADTYLDDDRLIKDETKHRDPEHRNRRIAQAGLVSAAGAALLERVRSKSRGGARSKSRIRQALPVVASGLGGAALAGLYEKNQANKDAKKQMIIEEELDRGRRGRSRSRSAAPYGRDSSRGMVAYGDDPVRPESDYGYYSDEEPGVYRRRAGSDGSSPDRRKSRSRSRVRNLAEGAAAGSTASYAAHAYGDRDRDNRRNDRYDEYSDQGPHSPVGRQEYAHAQPRNRGYGNEQQNNYPGGHYFPPPPENDYNRQQPAGAGAGNFSTYNPADYANQPPQHPVYGSGAYGESTGNVNQRGLNETTGNRDNNPAAGEGNRGRDAGNVSSFISPSASHDQMDDRRLHEAEPQGSDGLSTPQLRSPSRVRFDLTSNTEHSSESANKTTSRSKQAPVSPTRSRDSWESWSSSSLDDSDRSPQKHTSAASRQNNSFDLPDRQNQQPSKKGNNDDNTRTVASDRHTDRRGDKPVDSHSASTTSDSSSSHLMRDHYDRRPSISSDDTVELPSRFDKDGNPQNEGPLARRLSDVLSGKGGVGKLLQSLAENIGDGSHRSQRKSDA